MVLKNSIVNFKGSKEGLTVICKDTAEWNEIIETLRIRLQGKEGAFFAGASVTLNMGERLLTPEQVSMLWQVFLENGLYIRCLKNYRTKNNEQTLRNSIFDSRKMTKTFAGSSVSSAPTLIVFRNIRSGQDITFAGNVIIYGDVKPGSKITASGFILVLGNLMGTVHAGAEGDELSWVAALRLQPTQLRIADCITRAPEEKPVEPEIARLMQGTIVVSEWKKSNNDIM